MKSKLLIISLFSIISIASFSQIVPMGLVLEGLSMSSPILGREVSYAVYLPLDYKEGTRFYPVAYLLHGYTDDETGWIQFGGVNMAADRAIASREIPSMIFVMPDAKATWYVNSAALHILLRNRQIEHEFRVRDGGHTWAYWCTGIVDGLKSSGKVSIGDHV